MKYMGPNQFSIYAGDVNQDGAIDLFDLQQAENDASEFDDDSVKEASSAPSKVHPESR